MTKATRHETKRSKQETEREEEKKTPQKIKTSTKQVQKHRETLNIKFDFKKGNPQLNKSEELRKQKIQEEVSLLESSEKKAAVLTSIVNKQSLPPVQKKLFSMQ